MDLKKCYRCKQELPLSEFWKNKKSKDGLRPDCKKCGGEIYRKWFLKPGNKEKRAEAKRIKNPYDSTKRRNQRLKYEYGLTPEDYDRMLEAQGGRCAICKTDSPAGKGMLYIDHNHTTNEVRDLLCVHCNNLIGYCFESKERLQSAMDYLTKWENK